MFSAPYGNIQEFIRFENPSDMFYEQNVNETISVKTDCNLNLTLDFQNNKYNFHFHFKVYQDNKKNNRAVILCTYLEDWIIYISKINKINPKRFNLPNDGNRLHNIVNSKKSKFFELIKALEPSIQFQALKTFLNDF